MFSVFTVIGKFICGPREFDYLKLVVQVEGHMKQVKPRMRWHDIKEATGVRLEDLKEAVQYRKKWRTLVAEKTRNKVRTNVK